MTPRTQAIVCSAAAAVLTALVTVIGTTCQVRRPARAQYQGGVSSEVSDDFHVRLLPPLEVPLPVVRHKE